MSAEHDATLSAALLAASASGETQCVVVERTLTPEEAARDALDAFASARGERFYLERPSAGAALLALGACATIESAGANRLEHAAALLRSQAARVHCAPGASARWVGGFAFAPDAVREDGDWGAFGSCRFVLPRTLIARDARGARLTCAIRIEPSDRMESARAALARARDPAEASLRREVATRPAEASLRPERGSVAHCRARSELRLLRPDAGYPRLVSKALDAIAKGGVDKLVVARAVECSVVHTPLTRILRALRGAHASCTTFALAPRAATAFFGATPELLVRVEAGMLEVQALAGSARRGSTLARDARERSDLLASAKERGEHEHVVASLRRALGPLCAELSEPATPRALALGDVQHLETRLRGRLATGVRAGALELAARLHPSPAVAGAPRDAAERWLAEHEPLERGWYSGAIGWLDANGDGELYVALRCALLRAERARLFAGAGIVAGSRPAAEARETRLKLRAVFHALREASHARG